ncbi:MAG: hypothetical protein PUP93_12755 [Rhizonema sp. NSF051]|nr:hypothetical protein [Rhizonema sp. NSF051]
MYVANTDDNSVSVFDLADPTTPKEIQRVTIKQNSAAATELTFNSNESLLQVVDRRTSGNTLEGNAIDVFKVNPTDGTLSEIDSSPFPIESINGSFPQGLVTIPRHRL